jgi:hypothetical protein
MLYSRRLRRIPIILVLCQHGPDLPRHPVGQRDRNQHPRLPAQHTREPRPCGYRSTPQPIQSRHGADDQEIANVGLTSLRHPPVPPSGLCDGQASDGAPLSGVNASKRLLLNLARAHGHLREPLSLVGGLVGENNKARKIEVQQTFDDLDPPKPFQRFSCANGLIDFLFHFRSNLG